MAVSLRAKLSGMLHRALLAAIICPAVTSAQCIDFASGFGVPGNGLDNEVFSMVEFDDDGPGPNPPAIFVGGNFSMAGSVPAESVAKWDGANWSAVGGGLPDVTALCVHDDGTGPALYAAAVGIPGTVRKLEGSTWTTLPGAILSGIRSMVSFDDGTGPAIWVAGGRGIDGLPTEEIAAWNGTTWRRFVSGPTDRTLFTIGYDTARQRTVLFGGTSNSGGNGGGLNDTWTWDGTSWERVATTGPSPRFRAAMAWDSLRQRLVMYGGTGAGGENTETWAWDGSTWTMLTNTTFPTPNRKRFSMAYDAARDRIVLFGGEIHYSSSIQLNDTWEFDGTAWAQIPTPMPPPVRADYAIAYDESRQRVVLFGGYESGVDVPPDVWEWDGTTWTQITAPGPSRSYGRGMAYDSTTERVILFGANVPDSINLHETWSWDGTEWVLLNSYFETGPYRNGPIVYDAARDRIVHWNNETGTFLFDGTTWTTPRLGGMRGTFGQGGVGEVKSLVIHDDGTGPALYCAGTFTIAGGARGGSVAKWNGTYWDSLPDGPGPDITRPLASYDGKLWVGGGGFQNFPEDNQTPELVTWDGSVWTGVPQGLMEGAAAFAVFDDALYSVSGSFSPGYTFAFERFDGAAWSRIGTLYSTIQHPEIRAIVKDPDSSAGQRIYLAGKFTHAGGKPSASFAKWGQPCSPPVFTLQPADQTAVYPLAVYFTVQTDGSFPQTFQWRKDGIDITDSARIEGATTPTLQIQGWSLGDAGSYDVVVTNALGTVESDPAALTIPGEGPGGAVTVQKLLAPPEEVPGQPGSLFTFLASPVVSHTGEVTMIADIDGAPRHLVQVVDGTPAVLHSFRSQAPDCPVGALFGTSDNSPNELFTNYFVGSDQRALFRSRIYGTGVTGSNARGLWLHDAAATHLVVREGSSAPGASPTTFASLSNTSMALGDTGLAAFGSSLSGSFATNAGLWVRPVDTLQLMARKGVTAPGTAHTFQSFGRIFKPNALDSVLYFGQLNAVNGSPPRDSGLWVWNAGATQLIGRTGDPAPGFPSGYILDMFRDDEFVLGADDRVAFDCRVRGPALEVGEALYEWSGGVAASLIVGGDAVPGTPSGKFGDIYPIGYNSAGDLLFRSSIGYDSGCPGCPTRGLWVRRASGSLDQVMFNNGTPPDWLPTGYTLLSINRAAFNDSDQVVIEAAGEGNGGSWVGILGWTPAAGLFPMVVPGTQLEVGPDDFRTCSGGNLANVDAAVTGGRSTSLTPGGLTVIGVEFTGGSDGVFQANFLDFLFGFSPCILTVLPESLTIDAGESAAFETIGGADGPATFAWERDGQPLADGPSAGGGTIAGATTGTLTIMDAGPLDSDSYTITITSDCGVVQSGDLTLEVNGCIADFSGNGTADVPDIFLFLAAWFANDPSADINGVAGATVPDIFLFLALWFAGCD